MIFLNHGSTFFLQLVNNCAHVGLDSLISGKRLCTDSSVKILTALFFYKAFYVIFINPIDD